MPPVSTDPLSSAADGNAIASKKDSIARGMDSAASMLRDKAGELPGGDSVANSAHATADAMESAADYLRDQDLGEMLADLKTFAKRHPGAILLTAAALGFVLARKLARH